ncbi:MAG: hypothetical protein ABIP79_02305 [Chitinophagaceae bacterium]
MKRTFFFSASAVFSLFLVLTSCKSSKVWETKDHTERTPPPPLSTSKQYSPAPARYNFTSSLIISPRPGFTMNQTNDGRYYHRNQQGFLYWKGYDNRFYLDNSYLNRVNYTKWEYKDWKKYKKNTPQKRRQ